VARRIDQVQLVGDAVASAILERGGLGLDRDPALALEVHRIEHLRLHLAVRKPTAQLDDPVGKRGFTVVDMRDDGEIADMVHKRSAFSVQLSPGRS
jgi:hypothetical protein